MIHRAGGLTTWGGQAGSSRSTVWQPTASSLIYLFKEHVVSIYYKLYQSIRTSRCDGAQSNVVLWEEKTPGSTRCAAGDLPGGGPIDPDPPSHHTRRESFFHVINGGCRNLAGLWAGVGAQQRLRREKKDFWVQERLVDFIWFSIKLCVCVLFDSSLEN